MALQVLYQADLLGDDCMDPVEATLRDDGHPAEVVDYAFDLARGVRRGVQEIDALMTAAAQHWSVSRMAVVDRNVLRLGIEELLHHPDVPPRVVINEAIELAKRFSTSASGAFVNGVLDRVRKDLEAAGRIAPAGPHPGREAAGEGDPPAGDAPPADAGA
ncbi:MAG: transcription antitermination factor NusB [Planctomycetaceae bacterium]|nr:transcription antitermination factor NusB [Planctomycetaceae bacterium]